MRRYAILCVSTANLFFLSGWLQLLRFRAEAPNQMRSPAAVSLFLSTLTSVVLVAALLFAATYLIRKTRREWLWRAAQCGFLLLLVTPLDELAWMGYANYRDRLPDAVLIPAWLVVITVPVFGCFVSIVYARSLIRNAAGFVVTILAPLLPLSVVNFAHAYATAPSTPTEAPKLKAGAVLPARVVWLVFDELDYRLAFEARPASVRMPELDRLAGSSFFATDARPPGDNTPEAMVTLLTGRRVARYDPMGTKELVFANGERKHLLETRTIFDRARTAGLHAGVVGWFLPYCQTFRGLAFCIEPSPASIRPPSLGGALARQWNEQIEGHWLVTRFSSEGQYRTPWFGWGQRGDQLSAFRYLLEKSTAAATDPNAAIVLLHLPVPHPHGIYNRYRDQMGIDRGNNYLDNLELVDFTIGRIRSGLRASSLEASTVLLVTSDHVWRPEIWQRDWSFTDEERLLAQAGRADRIPFLAYFPRTPSRLTYTNPLQTETSADLILDILAGRLSSPGDVSTWIDRRAASATEPTPIATGPGF
jgi:hypothetical protein